MIQFVDHNYEPWQQKKKNENGAATYSKDIVASQLCNWLTWSNKPFNAGKSILLSTCVLISQMHRNHIHQDKVDIGIQYLHTYPYQNSIGYIHDLYHGFPKKSGKFKLILLSAYRSYVLKINNWAKKEKLPVQAFFVPMAIDEIPQNLKSNPIHPERLIWFGNLYTDKSQLFSDITRTAQSCGLQVDYISRQKLNGQGPLLDQQQAWEIISTYRYGIGVGRCALEMFQLGLKVLIAGANFGGLITNSLEAEIQLLTNHNGRVCTFDRDIRTCIESINLSIIPNWPSIHQVDHTTNLNG